MISIITIDVGFFVFFFTPFHLENLLKSLVSTNSTIWAAFVGAKIRNNS